MVGSHRSRSRSDRLRREPHGPVFDGDPMGPGPSEMDGAPLWGATAQRRPDPAGSKYGIRLGLKDVHGISDQEIDSILDARAERAFVDVGDVLRRTKLTRPVAEALAHAGAFDSLPGGSRRDRLYAAMVADAPREGEQTPLPLQE